MNQKTQDTTPQPSVSQGLPGDIVTARVFLHPDGFGFAEHLMEDGSRGSIFMSPGQTRGLFTGDIVETTVVQSERDPTKTEASETRLLARRTSPVVAVKRASGTFPEDGLGPRMTFPGEESTPEGTVVALMPSMEVSQAVASTLDSTIGHLSDRFILSNIAMVRNGVRRFWEGSEIAEAEASAKRVPTGKRTDLRTIPLVTIDGESTKDFDDAVFAEPLASGGWRLVVAVADVAEFVPQGSLCDQEARLRATSAYFPDMVVPMLPAALSDQACSLVPDQDRLCVFCEAFVSKDGVVEKFSFGEGVMRSKARLTYAWASENREDPLVRHLADVAEALRKNRDLRGTVDFDTRETGLVIENGRVTGVSLEESTPAHLWIEDCMLAANTAAAAFLLENGASGIWRNHPSPDLEKWEESVKKLAQEGVSVPSGVSDAQGFGDILRSFEGTASFWKVQSEMLKAFRPASYGHENAGHFSLNLPAYLHFTSPIRRYPDLVVHRAIKAASRGASPVPEDFPALSEACAQAQRKASLASRESRDAFVRSWLAENPGSVHPATVISQGPKAARIRLDDCGAIAQVFTDVQEGESLEVVFTGFDKTGRRPRFEDSSKRRNFPSRGRGRR